MKLKFWFWVSILPVFWGLQLMGRLPMKPNEIWNTANAKLHAQIEKTPSGLRVVLSGACDQAHLHLRTEGGVRIQGAQTDWQWSCVAEPTKEILLEIGTSWVSSGILIADLTLVQGVQRSTMSQSFTLDGPRHTRLQSHSVVSSVDRDGIGYHEFFSSK